MSTGDAPDHLPPAVLSDYFEHELTEDQQGEVEKHLADCDECTALARQVRRLSHAVGQWTAKTHAEALHHSKNVDSQRTTTAEQSHWSRAHVPELLEESSAEARRVGERWMVQGVAPDSWAGYRARDRFRDLLAEQPIRIVIAHGIRSERLKLKGLLGGGRGRSIQIIGEAQDGEECLALVSRLRPNVVLIKQDLPRIEGSDVAARITAQYPDVGVILILSGSEGLEIWHKMVRAGIREFITCPVDQSQLLELVLTAAEMHPPPRPSAISYPTAKHQVITMAAPRGGCGKTVLGANLAVAMARQSDNVALVDLNLSGGDVAFLMDLQPQRTLGDLLPGFGGIDRDVIDSVMTKHSSGVSVLSAPLTGDFRDSTLSRHIVQSVLKVLGEQYQRTIVDTGNGNSEATVAAMDQSDIILVVVGMDLPRLRDGKLFLRNLLAANYPKEKLRVVVNQTTACKEIAPSEVESILEFPVLAQLPSDQTFVRSSINLGKPFVISSPHNHLSKTLTKLAESLAPVTTTSSDRKRIARRLFRH